MSCKKTTLKINWTKIAFMMCEARITKMKRDIGLARRRVRRLLQIHDFIVNPRFPVPVDLPTSSESDNSSDRVSPTLTLRSHHSSDSIPVLQEFAARTIALMKRNHEIQRKVEELKRETADYVKSVMNNPENYKRFHPYLPIPTAFQTPPTSETLSDDFFMSEEDSRSLPDTDNTDTNDSHNVKLTPELKCKEEPLDDD